MRIYLRHIFTLCLAILSISSFDSLADNLFGIDSVLYRTYLVAINNPSDSKTLQTADSLYKDGVKKRDAMQKAIALTISFTAYNSIGQYVQADNDIETLKTLRSKHPEINMVYFVSMHNYIQYLLYREENGKAMLEASNMNAIAEETQHQYGLMLSYRIMALVYDYRLNYSMAAEYYKRALQYCSRLEGAENQIATIRTLLAQEQIRLKLYSEAKDQLDSASTVLGSNLMNKSLFNYMNAYLGDDSGDHELFWKYYDLIMDDPRYAMLLDEDSRNSISVDYWISKRDYSKAMEYADKIVQQDMHLRTLANIYQAMGDLQKGNQYLEQYIAVSDSLNAVVQSDDISMVDLEVTNSKLKSETAKMQSRIKTIIFSCFAALLAIVVAFLINNLRRNRKYTSALQKKNEDLQKAKDIAEDALIQAKNANETKTRFLQNMSHEIRTPLNAVIGFSQLMALPDGYLNQEEKDEYSQIIKNNSQMLSMLVDDILCLSDIENGKYTMDIGVCGCNEIARFSMKTIEQRVPSGVKLYFTSDVDDNFTIKTDERRVQQVLINFLTNACKHTESGEIHVDLSTKEKEGFVHYSVTDTGTGVPKEKIDEIFDRFVKLDATKAGAGIGLNICKVISSRLGGDIFLDPSYTTGARFVLELPLESKKEFSGLETKKER